MSSRIFINTLGLTTEALGSKLAALRHLFFVLNWYVVGPMIFCGAMLVLSTLVELVRGVFDLADPLGSATWQMWLFLAGTLGFGFMRFVWRQDRATPDSVEAMVAVCAGLGASTHIGRVVADQHLSADQKKVADTVLEWTQKAKLHFGELKDTVADRICLKRWLAEEMEKEDMRKVDQCRHIPSVVEMMFVPTFDEIFAARIRTSRVKRHLLTLVAEVPK